MKVLNRNLLFLALAFTLFALMLWLNPCNVKPDAAKVLAIATLMITLWISEAVPMPVVALMPLFLFPLMNICSMEDAAKPYANPVVFLFMGGFLIGVAIEKWNLHKRIALNIVRLTGTSGNRIILGFILSTGFLSMWLSNTATTMMMFPIAMSVVHVMETTHKGEGSVKNMAVCLLLAIAYSSNFGGIATIIGTPPNVAFVGFMEKKYHYTFQFIDWLKLCLPISLLLMFSLYLITTQWLFKSNIKKDEITTSIIKQEIEKLGKLTAPEKRVLIIFVLTAVLWITKDLINAQGFQAFISGHNLQNGPLLKPLFKLDDNMIAILGAVLLFIVPSNSKAPATRQILDWSDTDKMAWGILLLFGGGITLANQLEKAGLIQQLGDWVASHAGSNVLLLVFTITVISIFISEVMSNIAQVIVFSPVIAGIADALHMNPLMLGLPMTLAASCASMLPMGTPPNAIVFASHRLKLSDMLRAGFVMNIVSIILITLFSYYLLPLWVHQMK